jgi:hypothetical protein
MLLVCRDSLQVLPQRERFRNSPSTSAFEVYTRAGHEIRHRA